ncbi:MAG: hypothetical protein PUB42_04970 [Firmicutes bacterium]|nr:hypothetical protein [Bacillota bacterium]
MKKYIDGKYVDTDESYDAFYKELGYKETVELLIREKYSVSDEFALQRQKDAKQSEYSEYYAYCEECKKKARELTK